MSDRAVFCIAEWAAACNDRLSARDSSQEMPAFLPNGKQRLIQIASNYGYLLEILVRSKQWRIFLECLGQLALNLKQGVFVERGPETATDVVRCILAVAGLGPKTGIDPQLVISSLLDEVSRGNERDITARLKECYKVPVPQEPMYICDSCGKEVASFVICIQSCTATSEHMPTGVRLGQESEAKGPDWMRQYDLCKGCLQKFMHDRMKSASQSKKHELP